jgi:hypothetical protein
MKALLTWFTICVFAGSALAQTETPSPKPRKRTHRAAEPAPPAVTAEDLKALRDALAQQQQQLQDLQGKMAERDATLQQTQQQLQQTQSQLQDAQSKAATAVTAANQNSDTVKSLQSDVADMRTNSTSLAASAQDDQKKVSALSSAIGRFRLNGDVRVRGESFVQKTTQDRNRARIRIRLGLDGQLNQDFIGSVAIATGAQGDPTTTNETLTNAFERKTIALDKGYITYNPVAHSWLSLTGGKFPYLWQRTSVTGDPDLNPEGFDQKVSFDLHHHGAFKNFTVQAIELLYNEASGGQDSYVLGVQAQTKLEMGIWSATASFLNEHFNRPDALLQESAFAVGATTTGGTINIPGTPPIPITVSFPVPGEGQGCSKGLGFPANPPCVFAPNGMTNATYVDPSGKPHFWSGFDPADFILNNTFKTPYARLPVNLLLEFEFNLDAQSHPLDATGHISPLGKQDKEYGGDFSIGQTKNKNDVQFGYAWFRQEQDSVLASIAESDQRAPTNILQNRFYANWKVRSNTLAQFTWWHGRTLNTNLQNNAALIGKTITTAGAQEPYLNRLQFDLVYTY